MKRTLSMLCLGLALTLSLVGCTSGNAPDVTPTPTPPATTSPGVAGSAGTAVRPVTPRKDMDDMGQDMIDGVGDMARGVADGVGDMARDVGNGVKNAVR